MGEAVGNKDYPLLQALMLLTTVGVLVANLVADLLYGVLDPRAQEGRRMTHRRLSRHRATDFMAEGEPDQRRWPSSRCSDVERPDRWWQVIWSSKKARVGVVILAVYVLVGDLRPAHRAARPARRRRFEPLAGAERRPTGSARRPSGQDIASQLIYGTRISLLVGPLRRAARHRDRRSSSA